MQIRWADRRSWVSVSNALGLAFGLALGMWAGSAVADVARSLLEPVIRLGERMTYVPESTPEIPGLSWIGVLAVVAWVLLVVWYVVREDGSDKD